MHPSKDIVIIYQYSTSSFQRAPAASVADKDAAEKLKSEGRDFFQFKQMKFLLFTLFFFRFSFFSYPVAPVL